MTSSKQMSRAYRLVWVALLMSSTACSSEPTGPGSGPTGAHAGGSNAMTPTGASSSGNSGTASSGNTANSMTTGSMPTPMGNSVATPPASGPCSTDSTLSVNGAPPAAYITACSSCHGPTASGRQYYPSLRTNLTLDRVAAAVRGGIVSTKATFTTAQGKTLPARMPAFTPARLSNLELTAIYNYISAPLGANVQGAPYCLSRPEASWTPAQVQAALKAGLTAWRTPGTVDNNACTHCHGPDPMDLAFIGYTDSQIYRRAFHHVDQSLADPIIDMVHALRAQYKITAPPNPLTYRPFQPGGEVLPGDNSLSRDQAFGQELKTMGLALMGPPINDVAIAQKAFKELRGLNLRQLKVGIPLNKYTEDIFNNDGNAPPCPDLHQCDDHGTIADWITDAPVLTAATAAALYPLHDAYLANPTLDTLKAVLRQMPRDNNSWYKNKFLSTTEANFLFRQQASGMPMLDALPPAPFPVEMPGGYLMNSIWMVGANLRDFVHNDGPALTVGGGKFNVPADTIPGLAVNNANDQLHRVIVPWFWLGFTFDPSTLNVQPDYVAEGDEYFTQETFLDNGSYPIHGAFIVSKRTAEIMAYGTNPLPRSPNVFPFSHPDLGRFPVTPMTMRSGYFPEITNFAEQKNFNVINTYQVQFMPTATDHKTLYQTYTANMYRMFMWMLIGDLQQTPSIWNPTILGGKISKAEIFLKLPEVAATNGPQDTAMIAQARSLVSTATVNK